MFQERPLTARYRPFVLLSSLAALIVASALVSGQTGVTNGEVAALGRRPRQHEALPPLDQINRDNVKNLRIAWRWKIRELRAAAAEQHGRPRR